MKSEFISTNGIKLHCKVAGDGPLMILLHGFPEFWYSWRKQIPALSQHYKVVVPDMRGFNDSDKPEGIKSYSMQTLVDDVRGLITAFGEEKAIIVGHDWGGAVSWVLASYFPEAVDKLITLNIPVPAEMKKQIYGGNFKQIRKSWYILFFQIPWLPEWLMKRNLRNTFERTFKGWSFNPHAFTDADIDQYVAAYQKPGVLNATINYYRASIRYAQRTDSKKAVKIEKPVLMIWGENDRALGKELTYNTGNYCSDLDIKYIPNCSHWVQHEQPELVNQYILDFLEHMNG